VRAADIAVRPGEIHALVGANGAGKSTLVKILSGVFPPDDGSIAVHGEAANLRRPARAMAAGIATVFQDPALIPDLSLRQNLLVSRLSPGDVLPFLTRMDLGHIDLEMLAGDVPLAVLRLFDLARALAHDPQLLILDEITAALTPDQADHVFAVMREWKQRGRSVLFISHRLGEVLRMCDRATILRNGTHVADLDLAGIGEAGLVTAMLGEDLTKSRAAEDQAPAVAVAASHLEDAPVVLAARDLRLRSKLNGASFELRRGEILGLTGLEGQGQDELFKVLSGDQRPRSGQLLVRDQALHARSPFDAIRRSLVFVPADRRSALLPQRSVRENLALPLYNRARRWFSLVGDEQARVDRAVRRLTIDVRAGRQVQRLSGGNQQKVSVGRWLASGFDILLCFDPTRGIDIQTKAQIYGLLREVAAAGASVLLYTSELQEIPLVCDRVLVMYRGRIVAEMPAAASTEEALLTAAHGLGGKDSA
jgi:ribose transport system ATP-binding protein